MRLLDPSMIAERRSCPDVARASLPSLPALWLDGVVPALRADRSGAVVPVFHRDDANCHAALCDLHDVIDVSLAHPPQLSKPLASAFCMTTTTTTNSFLQRLIGAAALDAAIYEEVEADPKAGMQAAAVVILSSLAAGVGARGFSQNSLPNIALISIVSLMAWACQGALDVRDRGAGATGASDGGRYWPVDADDRLRRYARPPSRLRLHSWRHDSRVCGGDDLDARRDGRRRPSGARLQEYRPRGCRLRAGMGAGHGICVRVGSGVRTERFVGLPDDGRTEVLRYTSDANRLI